MFKYLHIDNSLISRDKICNWKKKLIHAFPKKLACLTVEIANNPIAYAAFELCLENNITFIPVKSHALSQNQTCLLKDAHLIIGKGVSYTKPNTAYIMHTSGSTGTPKAVPISYDNLSAFSTMIQERYQFTSEDRIAQFAHLNFDMAIFDLMAAYHSGASLYVVPERFRLLPAQFIRDHHITTWMSVPSIAHMLNQMDMLKANSLPSLRVSTFCGEALKVEDALAWQNAASNSIVDNLYGPTEATVFCSGHRFDSTTTYPNDIVSLGKPLGDTEIQLIDNEMVLKGPQVFQGYLNNDTLNQQRLKNGWYYTGDLATQDSNGEFHYLGRKDGQTKVNGEMVLLNVIEAKAKTLCHFPSCLAYKTKDFSGRAEMITLVYTGDKKAPVAIQQQLQKALQGHALPKHFIHQQQLQLNHNGKVDRQGIAKLLGLELC